MIRMINILRSNLEVRIFYFSTKLNFQMSQIWKIQASVWPLDNVTEDSTLRLDNVPRG